MKIKVDDPRLFLSSKVVDEDGDLVFVFHGTNNQFDEFSIASSVDGAFHFGTLNQAAMRGAGRNKRIIQAAVDIRKPRRSKDDGQGWSSKIKSAKKAGFDGIVYLNRYEGLSVEIVEYAFNQKIDLDKLSDAQFKKLVPEAEDSWIVFSADQMKIKSHNFDITSVSSARDAQKFIDQNLKSLSHCHKNKSYKSF